MKYNSSNINKSNIVLIKWIDSHHSGGEWVDANFLDEIFDTHSEVIISTVGFIYKENKKYISVVQSQDNQIDTDYDALMIIPKKAIIKISILSKSE